LHSERVLVIGAIQKTGNTKITHAIREYPNRAHLDRMHGTRESQAAGAAHSRGGCQHVLRSEKVRVIGGSIQKTRNAKAHSQFVHATAREHFVPMHGTGENLSEGTQLEVA
jgi:hypothetical protein